MQTWLQKKLCITSQIRILSIVCLILALAQILFDVVDLISYKETMENFQESWLYFNCAALVTMLIVLLYGFHAMAKKTYHSATNFRSWLLFIGSCLLFSGFFHIIGQIKDNHVFYGNCSYGFTGDKGEERLEDLHALYSHAYCYKLFHTQLFCYLALWGSHSVAIVCLFFLVNRYKNDNFCAEEEDRQEAHRQECEKRRLRMTRETGPGQTGDMIKPDSRRPSILVLPPLSNDLEAQSPNTGSEVSW